MRSTTLRGVASRAGAITAALLLTGSLFAGLASADEPDQPPTGPAPTQPADPPPADPAPGDPVPGDPVPGDPEPEPEPGDPVPGDPTPGDPTPSDPTPGEPAPGDPTPGDPAPGDPTPGEPGDPVPGGPSTGDPTPGDPESDDPDRSGDGPVLGGDAPAGEWPAAAVEPALVPGPDVEISAVFEPGVYLLGTEAPVTVTLTNTGDTVAQGVIAGGYAYPGPSAYVPSFRWGEFSSFGGGGTLEPGETVVIDQVATVSEVGGDIEVTFYLTVPGDVDFSDNLTRATVSFLPASVLATVGGVVFGDRNGNDAPDAGEGLAGVTVQLQVHPTNLTAVTGADGRFVFEGVPSGQYYAYITDVPDGWVLNSYVPVLVDGRESPIEVTWQAFRPLRERLTATLAFTADTYQVGDTTHLRLTLTNTGTTDLDGIIAGCDRSGGEGPHIVLGPEWDPLGYDSGGVSIAAGQSLVFELTGTVPAKAAGYGAVDVSCDFGDDETLLDGFPYVYDYARVPAPPVDVYLHVGYDEDGDQVLQDDEMLRGATIGLLNPDNDQLVVKDVTDAEGRADFTNLASGPYIIRVYGPWKFEYSGDSDTWHYFGSCHTCGSGLTLYVVPGPEVPIDPDPTTPPTTPAPTTPAPTPPVTTAPPAQGGARPGGSGGLADTGVSVVGLSVAGLLTLAVGLGTVLLTRRRREPRAG